MRCVSSFALVQVLLQDENGRVMVQYLSFAVSVRIAHYL